MPMKKVYEYVVRVFQNLNSLLMVVFIAFILDPIIFNPFLTKEIEASFLGVIIFGFLSLLKIFYYSGIYGSFIDIATNEQCILDFGQFVNNAKKYWKIYLLISLFHLGIHFFSFSYLSTFGEVSVMNLRVWLDFFFICLFVYFFIFKKYGKPLKIFERNFYRSVEIFFAFTVSVVFNILFLKLVSMHFNENFFLFRIEIFILKYIHFFIFFYLTLVFLSKYPQGKQSISPANEIYLIAPPGGAVAMGVISSFVRFYPPAFSVLKLLTPSKYKIKEFNQVFWKERYYASNKLVAITYLTSNAPEAYKIAKEFRQRGSTVIMGGVHATFLSDEALDYCDSVVIGEAEGVWQRILDDYEKGRLKKKYRGTFDENYFDVVHQNRKDLSYKDIARYLQTTRGCKFNCDFCVIPSVSGKKIRSAPIPEMIELIDSIKQKCKLFLFLDDNIVADASYAKSFFKALEPLKIKWFASSSIDIAKDGQLLELAKKSGCSQLLIGYEISDYSAQVAAGKFSMAKDYRELTKRIKNQGISIKGHFIYGYDSDNLKSLLDLWRFCFAIRPNTTIVSLLTPFPGSRMFDRLIKENRILNLNWRNYAVNHLVFEPLKFSRRLCNIFYPIIYFVFLSTTSTLGFFVLLFITAVIIFF